MKEAMPYLDSDSQNSYGSPTESTKSAVATVRAEEGEVVILLSNNKRRYPKNWNLSLPTEPYRAIVEYSDAGFNNDLNRYYIYIAWLEPIETGNVLSSVKIESPDEADPIGIVNDEFTSVEGGFLTIHYKINTSGTIPHSFSIIPGSDENPYEIVLMHDAHGDTNVYSEEGLVAFPLNWLPSAGEKVKLKVTYRDLDNKLSTLQFEYGT